MSRLFPFLLLLSACDTTVPPLTRPDTCPPGDSTDAIVDIELDDIGLGIEDGRFRVTSCRDADQRILHDGCDNYARRIEVLDVQAQTWSDVVLPSSCGGLGFTALPAYDEVVLPFEVLRPLLQVTCEQDVSTFRLTFSVAPADCADATCAASFPAPLVHLYCEG